MNEGIGMLILAPGFLFEFVVLPIWLIAKGFTSPSYPIDRDEEERDQRKHYDQAPQRTRARL
jgi:hypothetical protein